MCESNGYIAQPHWPGRWISRSLLWFLFLGTSRASVEVRTPLPPLHPPLRPYPRTVPVGPGSAWQSRTGMDLAEILALGARDL